MRISAANDKGSAGTSEQHGVRRTDRVAANLGGTSYTNAPALTLIEFNAAYFGSEEFQRFETDLHRWAVESGIEVVSFHQAMGVWQERPELPAELEPSASVELVGHEEDIVALAKRLGRTYKQYGMLLIVPDASARQVVYTIRGIASDEVADCIAAMKAYGVEGGRYINGRLEIADTNNRWRSRVVAVARRLHKSLAQTRARIRMLEGDEPGKAEGKDYEWAGPR